MVKHWNITASGKVVDVDFRFYIKQAADRLGIAGFAKNIAPDMVYIEAEGEEANLRTFADCCRRGSPWSKVQSLDIGEGELKNFSSFERIN